MTTERLVGTLGTVIVIDAVGRAVRRVARPSMPKSRARKKADRLKNATLRVRISAEKARALKKKGVALPTLAAAKKIIAAEKKRDRGAEKVKLVRI